MAFSATEAAFEGFRVVRRKPLALVFWSLFYILIFGLSILAVGRGMAEVMALSEALEAAQPTSYEEFVPLIDAYTSTFGLLMPLGIVGSAVLTAAIARSVLRPAESAFGYLRLGMDELRVLIVTVVLSIAFAVVLMVPMGFAAFMFVQAVSGGGGASVLGGILAVFATLFLALWLAVRFSLAVPITVAERKMAFFDSWSATKGRFWPLLGMGFIAFLMSLVVSLLGTIVVLPLQMGFGGFERMAEYSGQDLGVMLQAIWPAIVAGVITQSILSALQLAVLYAPFSAAYRDMTGDRPEKAFD